MKKFLLPIVIIVGIFIVWHPILKQALLGEGYYYFDLGQNFFNPNLGLQSIQNYLSYYDNLPRLIFDILPLIFRDNLVLYQGFELLSLIFLSLALYKTVNYLTKNKWISITSTVLFSTSYVGLFEMLAIGNYQRFAQRIPNFIFLILSFWLLARYFETNKIKYYLFSLTLFSTTVFLAHYSSFLLPLFAIFPLVEIITRKFSPKKLVRHLLVSASFVVITLLIIKNDFYNPGLEVSSIIVDQKNYFNLILSQLSSITYPPTLLTAISKIAQPYSKTISMLSIPIIFVYVLGFTIIKKKEPGLLSFYITSVLSLFAILLLNISIGKIDDGTFIRGDRYYFIPVDVLNNLGVTFTGGSRYYVLPTIFNSIILSVIFWVSLRERKRIFYFICLGILIINTIYNTKLVWKEIEQIQPVSERMKIYLKYAKDNTEALRDANILVTRPDFIWGSQFVRLFYANSDLKFIPLKEGWEREVGKVNSSNILVWDFDYENNIVIDKSTKTK